MILQHFTSEPLAFDPTRTYDQREPHGHGKPVGFWVSVEGEDDWPSWCRSEECFVGALTHLNRVELFPAAAVFYIRTGAELETFHEIFAHETDFDRRYGYAKPHWPIDWRRVSKECDGVIIAPYLWQHRLSSTVRWYYGWDCASGCIWNLSAIESVTAMSEATR